MPAQGLWTFDFLEHIYIHMWRREAQQRCTPNFDAVLSFTRNHVHTCTARKKKKSARPLIIIINHRHLLGWVGLF